MSKKHQQSEHSSKKTQSKRLPAPKSRLGEKRLVLMAVVPLVLAGIVLVVVKSKSSSPTQESSTSGAAGQKWYSEIPGIDFTKLTAEQREAVLKRLNTQNCGCGCGMTLAQCRHEDRNCPVSPGLVAQIVQEMTGISFPVSRPGQPNITINSGPQQGQTAPDFTLQDIQGRTWRLSALRGKVVVLNFWATWCGPCRIEIPDFIKVYRERRDQGLEIIGVSIDRVGVEVVKNFVEKSNINYPVAMQTPEVAQGYGNPASIPTTFIIDRQGRLHSRHVGTMRAETLEAALKPVF
jgi:cytochrome c biogenesis protein CcmG/thiol:disulfide interchange protein DsbE